MIYVGIDVGIDVAKDKHDCYILDAEGKMMYPVFTISNNKVGFDELLSRIEYVPAVKTEIKLGLEAATGHYSNNLLAMLVDKGFPAYVINPLHTNLYRKGLSLRKTKTDKVDATSIAVMLLTDRTLKPYSDTSYHNEELKSLTRYRFDKVHERSKLKSSLSRLVNILFPKLERLVPSLHLNSVYTLLEELPWATYIAGCHLTHLKKILETSSKGQYSRDTDIEIRNAAIDSIGTPMAAKSMELKHTIHLIWMLSKD